MFAESTSVHVRYAVEVEVVDVEDVGEILKVAVHSRHGVHIAWCLRPHLVGRSVHAGDIVVVTWRNAQRASNRPRRLGRKALEVLLRTLRN